MTFGTNPFEEQKKNEQKWQNIIKRNDRTERATKTNKTRAKALKSYSRIGALQFAQQIICTYVFHTQQEKNKG